VAALRFIKLSIYRLIQTSSFRASSWPIAMSERNNEVHNMTTRILQAYVDDDGLRSYLTSGGHTVMSFVKYISYDKDRILRLFCCGACLGCPAPLIRNVCNILFCNMVHSVMKEKFKVINAIVLVLTRNTDFKRIAESHVRVVEVTCDWSTPKPFLIQKKIMLDWHPDIYYYIKVMKHRGAGCGHDESSWLSFEEEADNYNAWFVVNDIFKVCNITGKLVFKEGCFCDGLILPKYAVELE